MIQIKGKYELADYAQAQKLHTQRGKFATWGWYFVLGVVVLLILVGFFATITGHSGWSFALLPAVFLIFYGLLQFVILPRQVKRIFNQQKDLSVPFEIELTEQTFAMRNEFGSYQTPWRNFLKWRENQDLLMLYRSDLVFNMVLKRLLTNPGDLAFIHEQLRRNEVPEANKVRNPVRLAWAAIVLALVIIVSLFLLSAR